MWDSICLRSAMGKMWGESVPVVAALDVFHGMHGDCSDIG